MFSGIHKQVRSSPEEGVNKTLPFGCASGEASGVTQLLWLLKIKAFWIQQQGKDFIAMHWRFQELLKWSYNIGSGAIKSRNNIHCPLTPAHPDQQAKSLPLKEKG